MRNSASNLLKALLAGTACASITLCGTLPAAARGERPAPRTAAAARTAPPARAERISPVRESAPVRYVAPVRVEHRAAPVRYVAPVRVEHHSAPSPFVQRVIKKGNERTAPRTAPFVQYVHVTHRTQRRAIERRSIATSPLVRTMRVAHVRTIPVVYHPRYIAGRVRVIRRNEIVIDPPAGAPVVVRNVIVGTTLPAVPIGSVVTVPVTYSNGVYEYVAPAYAGYGGNPYYPQYGYPQYGYPQYAYAPPAYCNGNNSSLLYAALLPAVIGVLTGNGSGLNSSDLASVALTAGTGGNGCGAYAPAGYYAPAYAAPAEYGYAYAAPAGYAVPADQTYATPYDNCLYSSDEDGDEAGCTTMNA